MQQIWDEHAGEWGDDVALIAVNGSGLEDGIVTLNSEHPEVVLPVLQDDTTALATWNCGASGKYFYLIDGDRWVHYVHYSLHIDDPDGDGQRALDEIAAVLGSKR